MQQTCRRRFLELDASTAGPEVYGRWVLCRRRVPVVPVLSKCDTPAEPYMRHVRFVVIEPRVVVMAFFNCDVGPSVRQVGPITTTKTCSCSIYFMTSL